MQLNAYDTTPPVHTATTTSILRSPKIWVRMSEVRNRKERGTSLREREEQGFKMGRILSKRVGL